MNEKNLINDRIEKLINTLNMNKLSFAKKVGTSDAVIGNIVGGRRSDPSYELIKKIIHSIDKINIEWLIEGKGEMFVSNLYSQDKQMIIALEEKIEFLNQIIEGLKENNQLLKKSVIPSIDMQKSAERKRKA